MKPDRQFTGTDGTLTSVILLMTDTPVIFLFLLNNPVNTFWKSLQSEKNKV